MSTLRLLTILKAAAERAASGGRVLKALLGLSALLLAFAPPMARAGGAAGGPNFQVCDGYYALCAASTCVTTNKTITVNGTGLSFPQLDCTCPIFHGRAIADVTGGNMQGSCNPPVPPSTGQIWSLFSPEKEIPQDLTNWAQVPESKQDAPQQICPATKANLIAQSANCFSFSCDSATYVASENGGVVPVVTCHCPMGESFSGTPVKPYRAFAIQAGQTDASYCGMHPITLPLERPN